MAEKWYRAGKPQKPVFKDIILMKYGPIAFNRNGTIKVSFINKLIKEIELHQKELTTEIGEEKDADRKKYLQDLFKMNNQLIQTATKTKLLKESTKESKHQAQERKREKRSAERFKKEVKRVETQRKKAEKKLENDIKKTIKKIKKQSKS